MISESKIERLVKESAALKLKWDGVPVFYNIKTGKIGQTGEIKITAKRDQVVGEGREARFDL
ncbi:MAG: hypothetical protein ACON4K_13395 [Akkermansiaceae bacterium]